MNNPKDLELKSASAAFVVANTPLYLIRKLRSDAIVQELSRFFDRESLLNALREAATVKPTDPVGAVRPYAYLVALALKPDPYALRGAGDIKAIPDYEWFEYIKTFLIKYHANTNIIKMGTPQRLPTPLFSSDSKTETPKIIVPSR